MKKRILIDKRSKFSFSCGWIFLLKSDTRIGQELVIGNHLSAKLSQMNEGSFCALIFFGGLLLLIAGIFSYRHRKKNLWGKSIYLVQKCFFSKVFDYWLFYKDT